MGGTHLDRAASAKWVGLGGLYEELCKGGGEGDVRMAKRTSLVEGVG